MKILCGSRLVHLLLTLLVLSSSCSPPDAAPPERPKQQVRADTTTGDTLPKTPAKGRIISHGPTDIVRYMAADYAGNMWFATWEGAYRYDGTSFTNFSEDDGVSYNH